MFRKMRRFQQELAEDESIKILSCATHGVLAVSGDGGYPYAVPLSYVLDGKTIYFHCAREGHKLDAIKSCSKVSFCVVSEDNVVPEKYTTYYRSVIAFGRARVVEDEAVSLRAMELLAIKYHPNGSEESRMSEIDGALGRFCVVGIEIEHLSGKEAKELMVKGKREER